MFKDELFGRHLQVLKQDCNTNRDQLTSELQHFVSCVQYGSRPRVSGEDGRDAIALASRILQSMACHQWTDQATGPLGPLQLPIPAGPLFQPQERRAAA